MLHVFYINRVKVIGDVGYLKKGYPKQRPKNQINRTHVVSAEISDSPETLSPRPSRRGPFAEASGSPIRSRLLAEAPSPRPQKIYRFSDSREAGSAPALRPPL